MKAIVIAEALPNQDFYDIMFQLAPELETASPGGLNARKSVLFLKCDSLCMCVSVDR